MQAAVVLGYAGATLAFFFSIAGAYITGSKLVSSQEAGFFTFLEDFQDNDKYINMIDDEENGPAFHDFLNNYAWYQLLLELCSFWHILFIIGMGTAQSIMIFMRVNTLDTASSSDIDINAGWLLFLMGLLYGATNYMASIGLSVNNDTILTMTGFMSKADSDTTITRETITDMDGVSVTTITNVSQNTEAKKNFFAMNEFMSLWDSLFFFQQSLQMLLPFLYIFMLETAVVMVLVLTVLNYF